MIGEIRDRETASIANQAARTGHFVLATLHTNSAAASLPRLVDMGLEPYLLASTVRGILSQRLVRKLCGSCCALLDRGDDAARIQVQRLASQAQLRFEPDRLRKAIGCRHCSETGYSGRIAIGELLLVDDEIRRATLDHADAMQLEKAARKAGLVPLLHAGIARVLTGETTLEELFRVTGERLAQ
jgi:general secretion pathway protein E